MSLVQNTCDQPKHPSYLQNVIFVEYPLFYGCVDVSQVPRRSGFRPCRIPRHMQPFIAKRSRSVLSALCQFRHGVANSMLFRCVRSQRGLCCNCQNPVVATPRENQSFVQFAAKEQWPRIMSRTRRILANSDQTAGLRNNAAYHEEHSKGRVRFKMGFTAQNRKTVLEVQ